MSATRRRTRAGRRKGGREADAEQAKLLLIGRVLLYTVLILSACCSTAHVCAEFLVAVLVVYSIALFSICVSTFGVVLCPSSAKIVVPVTSLILTPVPLMGIKLPGRGGMSQVLVIEIISARFVVKVFKGDRAIFREDSRAERTAYRVLKGAAHVPKVIKVRYEMRIKTHVVSKESYVSLEGPPSRLLFVMRLS